LEGVSGGESAGDDVLLRTGEHDGLLAAPTSSGLLLPAALGGGGGGERERLRALLPLRAESTSFSWMIDTWVSMPFFHALSTCSRSQPVPASTGVAGGSAGDGGVLRTGDDAEPKPAPAPPRAPSAARLAPALMPPPWMAGPSPGGVACEGPAGSFSTGSSFPALSPARCREPTRVPDR
jgi:hypothetical protein